MRFIKWQINGLINPYPIVYPFTEHSKLLMWKGLTGATGNLYCGLMEYQDMSFLLHFLKDGDLFIDIGANVGVYTILASAEVKANTISIEPVPSTFNHLMDNIRINNIQDKVLAYNIGLGKEDSVIKFTRSLDTVNHVAIEGESDTIDVQVKALDNILSEVIPVLLKIDVEGFETAVLNGAEKLLQEDKLKAIIIELNGSGERYGYDENDIHQKLLALGFLPYDYNPFERRLTVLDNHGKHNTIYVRDIEFVQARITTARKINVHARWI